MRGLLPPNVSGEAILFSAQRQVLAVIASNAKRSTAVRLISLMLNFTPGLAEASGSSSYHAPCLRAPEVDAQLATGTNAKTINFVSEGH